MMLAKAHAVALRLLGPGAIACLALAAWQTWHVVQRGRWNTLIAAGGTEAARGSPPEVRFAAAYAVARRGDVQDALNRYRELLGVAGPRLRREILYNSATSYLEQAAAARSGPDPSAALTLIELAKASYRELLREDAGDWDARYNLEKALRLAPDPIEDSDNFPTPPSRLHTPPSGQGTVLDLP